MHACMHTYIPSRRREAALRRVHYTSASTGTGTGTSTSTSTSTSTTTTNNNDNTRAPESMVGPVVISDHNL